MAQISRTHEQRVSALRRLGYTSREAHFICLAGLHSGYFLRRQYNRYLGKSAGGTAEALVEKLLQRKHASGTTFAGNRNVYHLCSRPLYAALGQEDNRNRRLVGAITIKNRLMALDFVLRHPHHEYLATEQEKLDFFITRLRLEQACLPAVRFVSRERTTERFFVEKWPIFLAPSEPSAVPVVSFCFIDEGEATLSAFGTFLRKYSLLFTHLAEFQLVYVAANEIHFQAAESAFERFSQQLIGPAGAPSGDDLAARLVEHFEVRRLHDEREWNAFDRAKLIRYRNDLQEFSGQRFQALYHLWKTSGTAALNAALNTPSDMARPHQWTFLTCELKENYDLFGHITTN